MHTKRILAGSPPAAAALAVSLTGCSSTPANGTGGTAETSAGAVDAAHATNLDAFVGLTALEAAVDAEGALNVIALPHDWAN